MVLRLYHASLVSVNKDYFCANTIQCCAFWHQLLSSVYSDLDIYYLWQHCVWLVHLYIIHSLDCFVVFIGGLWRLICWFWAWLGCGWIGCRLYKILQRSDWKCEKKVHAIRNILSGLFLTKGVGRSVGFGDGSDVVGVDVVGLGVTVCSLGSVVGFGVG